MLRIFRILKYIVNLIWSKINPIGYAKHLGVKLGENITFYGMKPYMFSTEPWLIKIGDNCHITSDCTFITHDGGTLILRKEIPDLELTSEITIGNNVYIGVRTTILLGTKVGNRCIIGACSLLKGEYPDNSVIAGIPAKVIKTVDEYKEKAEKNSLHLGHLDSKDKEKALKKYFGIES